MLWSALHVFPSRLPLSLCAGDVLFQMAEVHRQIQVQLEEMVGIPSSEMGVFRLLHHSPPALPGESCNVKIFNNSPDVTTTT